MNDKGRLIQGIICPVGFQPALDSPVYKDHDQKQLIGHVVGVYRDSDGSTKMTVRICEDNKIL